MTLLDAPQYDAARAKRKKLIVQLSAAALFVLLVVYWLVASRPVDWPWHWQQHPQQYSTYPFKRFQDDWSPTSPDNDYGPIRSHTIALAGPYGNGLLVAVLINGRKSDALNLDYDPKTGQLSFAPPGVSLYLGP